MTGQISKLVKDAGKEASTHLVKSQFEKLTKSDAERAEDDEDRTSALKWMLIIGGGAFAVLALMLLAMGALKWVLRLAVLGAVGAGIYYFAKPWVDDLKRRLFARRVAREQKRLADEAAQAALAAERAAEEAKRQKAQALEDQLAALKQNLKDGDG